MSPLIKTYKEKKKMSSWAAQKTPFERNRPRNLIKKGIHCAFIFPMRLLRSLRSLAITYDLLILGQSKLLPMNTLPVQFGRKLTFIGVYHERMQ